LIKLGNFAQEQKYVIDLNHYMITETQLWALSLFATTFGNEMRLQLLSFPDFFSSFGCPFISLSEEEKTLKELLRYIWID